MQSRTKSQRRLYPITGRTLAEENLREASDKISQRIELSPYSPQRVGLPFYFNTPIRKDNLLDSGRYSGKLSERVNARRTRNYLNNESLRNMSYRDRIDTMQCKKRVKDYSILAFACKRANNHRNEGRAYYSCGVLYDNLGEYHKAIKCYEKFLAVCQNIGDIHGTALAYNCIGVAYQRLGGKYYKIAIEYHKKYYMNSEVKGKFIATLNLALIYDLMGDKEKAAMYNQEALIYAAQVEGIRRETAVMGNLGRIGTSKVIRDVNELKVYAEKYLALSLEMKHKEGEAEANIQLGKIEQTLGNHTKSVDNFNRARKVARELRNTKWEHEASVRLGIIKGEVNWKNRVNEILKSINHPN